MTPLEEMNSKEVGDRLRSAREAAGMNQAAAAGKVDIARTTLIAIEKGERRVRIGELQQLAKTYGTSVNALLRQEALSVDLAPRFRRLSSGNDEATNEASALLAELATAEVEMENLLGVKRKREYPPERPLLRGDVRVQAEQDALDLRQRFGLGIGPILDIVSLLELEMGVRVYIRKLDAKISGLFAYDETLGPCMLLNANHPRERRVQSAAHETGHFLSTRREAEILHSNEASTSREERYASAFGRSFLTPARAVAQKFEEVTAGSDRLNRRHIIILAHFFGVSREAIVRRLEELQLVKANTWDWFEGNGGITAEQARQVLGDLILPDSRKVEADQPTTLKLNLLASEVRRRDLLSEGQLARLLKIDRLELRQMLDGIDWEGSDIDAATALF